MSFTMYKWFCHGTSKPNSSGGCIYLDHVTLHNCRFCCSCCCCTFNGPVLAIGKHGNMQLVMAENVVAGYTALSAALHLRVSCG